MNAYALGKSKQMELINIWSPSLLLLVKFLPMKAYLLLALASAKTLQVCRFSAFDESNGRPSETYKTYNNL